MNMPTDKDKLTTLLAEFGIPFEDHGSRIYIECVKPSLEDAVQGYSGFFAEFEFHPDGQFKVMAIAE